MNKFDIISDIHIDFWVKENATVDKYKRFIKMHIKPKSEHIIIAGDLAHNRMNGLKFMEALKTFYKNIIFVFGNHDLYMTKKEFEEFHSYKEKVIQYKKELQDIGIIVLDGETVEIDGVNIFGCGMWYSFSYMDKFWKNIPDYEIGKLWSDVMNDANWIKGLKGDTHLESFDNNRCLFTCELEKFFKDDKYINANIIITHISPVDEPMYIPEEYRYDKVTSFFCFNGIDEIKKCNAEYFIFGHTHKYLNYELFDTKLLCNPLGYPSEHLSNKSIQIEINKC